MSYLSSPLGLHMGSQPHHRLSERASLAQLPLSSQTQPVCFSRPWELLLCSSCAAEGTHRRCSYLSNDADAWECKACAGVGTGKKQIARRGAGKA